LVVSWKWVIKREKHVFTSQVPTFFVATLYMNSKQFSIVLVHSSVNDVSINLIEPAVAKQPTEGRVFIESVQKPNYFGIGFSRLLQENKDF
jgi:hypothetical protein